MPRRISLKTAKARSLKRWELIKGDLPNIKVRTGNSWHPDEKVYGGCGFCNKFLVENEDTCAECPLYYEICSNCISYSLYWLITEAIRGKSPALPQLVDQMIEAIKAVEVRSKMNKTNEELFNK